jgi:N4-gp56 family major capsid protein
MMVQILTNTGTAGDNQLALENKPYYDRKLLMRATPFLSLSTVAEKKNIPAKIGDNIEFRRFNRLAIGTTPLVEAITPTASDLSISAITAKVQGYGNGFIFSDQIQMMGFDPIIEEATNILGENSGQVIESIMIKELVTGTSVLYGTGTTRGAQNASNPITLDHIRKAVTSLNANNAKPVEGQRDEKGFTRKFFGLVHPFIYHDLVKDPALVQTFQYSDPDGIYNFECAQIMGVNFYQSTLAPVFAGAGAGGVDVYGTLIIGKEAFGMIDPAGLASPKTIVKPLGSSGVADYLDQRSSVGWKNYMAAKNLNNDFFLRIETARGPF